MKQLIFRGELRPGVDRAEAVAALARMFRRPPEQIEQRLFGAGDVRIKTVESAAEAARYAAAFARAGAVLEIRDPARAATDTGTTASAQTRHRRRPAWIALAGLVPLVLVAAAAWYFAPLLFAGDRSEAETRAARALAGESIVLLAHLDLRRAAALESRLFGAPDPGALLGEDDNVWTSLERAGLDPRSQVDDVLAAGYVGKSGFETATIVLGRFDPARVRGWIDTRYGIEETFASSGIVHFRSGADGECAPGRLLAAQLTEERLVIAPAVLLPVLLRRLADGTEPAIELDRWQALGAHQIATLGLFAPDRLGEAAGGMAGMLLAAAGKANRPAGAGYLGIAPALMPPGVVLEAAVVSEDGEYLERSYQGARAFLDRSLEQARTDWPELVPLYQRVEVARDGPALRGSLRLDTDFDDEIRALVTAALADVFSFDPGAAGARPEVIEDDPRPYRDAGPRELRPFAHWGDADNTGWQGGPFAVRILGITVDEQDRHVVELSVEGRDLPNLGSTSSGVRLRVEEVVDAQGESLLPLPECGADDLRGWVNIDHTGRGTSFRDGEMVHYSQVRGRHQLTLVPGATAADVAHIRGALEYDLPTRVVRRRVEAPLAGTVIEEAGLRLRFRSSGAQDLAYRYSGDTARLLAVRALNDEGQVLREHGAMRGGEIFGSGRHVSVAYRGDVAGAEVVLAQALETSRYAFALAGAVPSLASVKRQPPPLPRASVPGRLARAMESQPPPVSFEYNRPRQTLVTGPVLLSLRQLQVSSGLGLWGRLELYVPRRLPLAHRLNAATVHLDAIVDGQGRRIELDQADTISLDPAGAHWRNGEYTTDDSRPWLTGSSSFQLSDYSGDLPRVIEGRVVLRTATSIDWMGLPATVGSSVRGEALDAAVIGWFADSQGSVNLKVGAPLEKIVAATAEDATGRRVDMGVMVRDADPAATTLTVRVARWPATMRLQYARASEQREQPFRIELGD